MFWSPAFGSSILGKNWSAYSANTIVAERGNASDWEDYWSIHNSLDAAHNKATVSGTIRDQPIQFERQYQFLDDRVICDLTLHSTQPATYTAVWECFPYPLDKPDAIRVGLFDEQGRAVAPNQAASAIVFQNSSPEAHIIVFSQPRLCEIGVDHSVDAFEQPHEYGRVLVALPARWQKDDRRIVRWSIASTPADGIEKTIRRELAGLRH